jgi:hypothetical protein
MPTRTILEAPDFSEVLEGTPLWSEILPDLWMGGTSVYDESPSGKPFITPAEFDTVVTMYQYANPVDWLVKEYRYCIYDGAVRLIDLASLFDTAKFAHEQWLSGKRVLVRCQAGLNRSGLVTALVLIREGYEPAEAIALLREKRHKHAICNRDFESFLLSLDKELWRGDSYSE